MDGANPAHRADSEPAHAPHRPAVRGARACRRDVRRKHRDRPISSEAEARQQVVDLRLILDDVGLAFRIDLRPVQQ